MELVLQDDGKAVQGPDEFVVRLEIVVQLFCARQGGVESNLEQKVALLWLVQLMTTLCENNEGVKERLRTSWWANAARLQYAVTT